MPMHARPNAEAAANALLDHITSLDGPQVLAEARCIAASADGLDELGVDPTVSIMFRTLGVLTSRLDATSADAVDGAIAPADSCTCHNGADVSTRTLMARVLKATALDAALGRTAN